MGPRGNYARGPKPKIQKGTLKRLLKVLFKGYKWQLSFVLLCIIVSSITTASTGIFLKTVITAIGNKDYNALISLVALMAGLYIISILSDLFRSLIMARVTQGFLHDTRVKMFKDMQDLPIKYFDTHNHGDIMSMYTNDVDALRQLVSSGLLTIIQTAVSVVYVFATMLYYSISLTFVVVVFVIIFSITVKKIAGNSAKFFVKQQKSLGACEGFIEEAMHGQKVIKVFTHEEKTCSEFDKLNNELRKNVESANTFANILGPITNNLGHFLYVILALAGTFLAVSNLPIWFKSLSISGEVISIAIIIAFLPMGRNFTRNISQVSNQINMIFMGLAGAQRVFALIDEKPEEDNGYVTLVKAKELNNGELIETNENDGLWAWKHPHGDGSVSYVKLQGDIRFYDVDFGYRENHVILHNITLYAEPGQKVAFVGATGAGKTTITNLINRFYDIQDGKIRYDGININKIKKADLRRSLGIVLQDVSLFSGTVMDNIRYGRLDATDEECIEAAKRASAHEFITKLPNGYHTYIKGDGSNFSQGQRQLLSIARASIKNAPAMILDEATSSIDTRTELLVEKGTFELMKGRTVFVIAHRLSTVQNSDVIMVLDKGRIIERGNHQELIEQKGEYYKLYMGSIELE
ncbi:MAG: ABC transporter ATP-binding protein [Clostridia bacterium]|nr:ABC transporter ATP-binding protein [Clostridia bacterium]